MKFSLQEIKASNCCFVWMCFKMCTEYRLQKGFWRVFEEEEVVKDKQKEKCQSEHGF